MTASIGVLPESSTRGTLDLRPLSTGELIDRGFSLYRNHFAGLFLLALLCQIAPLVTGQALLAALKFLPAPGMVLDRPETYLPRNILLVMVWIIGQILTFGFEVVITSYLAAAYLEKRPSVKSGFLVLRSRIWASIKTCLLNLGLIALSFLFPLLALIAIYFWILFHPPQELAGLLILSSVGFILAVLSIAPLLVVFMRLMLTVPAVALENLSGWAAAKRSSDLVRFDPGLGFLYWGEMRLSVILLPLFVIELLAFAVTSLPFLVHDINEAILHGSIGQLSGTSDTAMIFSQILLVLSSSLLLPLYLIATTLFYYDVRVRREGFDLELMVERERSTAS